MTFRVKFTVHKYSSWKPVILKNREPYIQSHTAQKLKKLKCCCNGLLLEQRFTHHK